VSLNERDLARLVDATMEHFKEVEGFSEEDADIANRILGATIVILWFNKLPLYHAKYPVVLRVLANVLEQIQELKKKGGE